jgi:hypothetical protein
VSLVDFHEGTPAGEWFDRPMVVGLDPSLTGTGIAYVSSGTALFKLGELGGLIRVAIAEMSLEIGDMRWAVVPPATLKTYALGVGRGDKTAMVVAARERLGFTGLSHDQADAYWLRAMGLDLLGSPLVVLPKTHRRALDTLVIHDKSEVSP